MTKPTQDEQRENFRKSLDDAEELYRVSRRGFAKFWQALNAYLAQQTAAKDAEDAEIAHLTIRVTEERRAWESSERHREAIQRERDSLREANARLAADLDAALKAEKDGQ